MLFELSPKRSTRRSAWPSPGSGACTSSKRQRCRSSFAIRKSTATAAYREQAARESGAMRYRASVGPGGRRGRERSARFHGPASPVRRLGGGARLRILCAVDRPLIINLADAPARRHPDRATILDWEPEDAPWPDTGVNVQVMQPGQPNCKYHDEPVQEDFLVLHGECIAIIA